MYAESYMRQMEQTGLTAIIDAAQGIDSRFRNGCLANGEGSSKDRTLELAHDNSVPSPPEALERAEEPTAFASLLGQALTPDERALLNLVERVADEEWRLETGKALRGELRRMFTGPGRSERRFYLAFHGLQERILA